MQILWRVAYAGGNANNSSKAGAFYLNANNDSTNANSNIGRRLKIFQVFSGVFRCMNPASWQNTKQGPIGIGRLLTEDSGVK